MRDKRVFTAMLFAGLLWHATAAVAGCYGLGEVSAKVRQGAAGTKVTISGQRFLFDCPDTCFIAINCPPPPPSPAKQIRLLFVQGERVQELLRADAKADFTIDVEVLIPADAKPGAASIMAEYQNINGLIKTSPVPFTVLPKQ